MAIVSDSIGWVSGVVDQDFLGDEEQAGGGHEALVVERSVLTSEFHEVNRREVTSRVVEEHVFRAGVRRVDSSAVRAGVPLVDRRVVLNTWVTAVPSAVGHTIEDLTGFVGWWFFAALIGNPASLPVPVSFDGFHEVIGHANREVCILEHDRRIRFAVEVRFVAFADQRVGFLLFFPFAFDEFHDVWVPDFDRLHLRSAASLAAGLHNGSDLVVDTHEREWAAGFSTPGECLAAGANRRKVGSGTGAELKEHRFARCQAHDVFHVVVDALDEASGGLWVLVRIFGLFEFSFFNVVSPVALRADDVVLLKESDVKPNGRVERTDLVQAKPG